MLISALRRLRRHSATRTRGQSLVEFALVLPLLLLLVLTALDFGRVYLGWVNLQNMSRIAANIAANHPNAWTGGGDAAVKAEYRNQILADASATNCTLPKVSGVQVVPAPTFTDADGNGSATQIGDTAYVQISCTFGVITPFISNIVGGSIQVSASSTFPVKAGLTAVAGPGGGGGSAPNAAFMGNAAFAPSSLAGLAPFNVVFRDTSGGVPTAWLWDFADGTTSTAQDPLGHSFAVPGTYVVRLTASNLYGSSSQTMGITVSAPSTVDFTSNRSSGNAPLSVTFTDASSPGGTSYAWTFGAGEGTGTGTAVSHTYSTPGTYDVSLTVTYPAPIGPISVTKTGYITVSVANCVVPSLNGVKRNDAPGVWSGAGFGGAVSDGPGAPSGNYTINTQSITATSTVPCSSSIVVTRQ